MAIDKNTDTHVYIHHINYHHAQVASTDQTSTQTLSLSRKRKRFSTERHQKMPLCA